MNTTTAEPSAWSFKNFRMFTYSGLLLPFAAQAQSLIIGWQIYEIKRDPLYLGFIGLAEALPAMALAMIAGTIVDRTNPLRIHKAVGWLNILTAGMLLSISMPGVEISETSKIFVLYLAAFLAGVARGFRMPTRTSLVPLLVPREALHLSSAWSSSVFSIASALGPALAGFLFAWKGSALTYSVNFALIAVAIVFNGRIQVNYLAHKRPENAGSFEDLTAGIRYVFSHPLLLPALALDMFAVLFGGAVALLPVFAVEILNVGPTGLGVLRGAASVGALIGSVLLIRYPVRRRTGIILLASVAGFGFCMIGFGLSRDFWLSASLLALGGAFDSISMVIRGTVIQLSAPPELRGRVGAVNSVFISVSNQLGEFESGVMAKLFGTALSVILGGVATIIVVTWIAARSRELRKMELQTL